MKRRGFLGLLGGAAVAGPGMAKQAISDLSIGNVLKEAGIAQGGVFSTLGDTVAGASAAAEGDWLQRELAKVLGLTAAQHAKEMREMSVVALDPDIASYRAVALHRKISLQRERDYWRRINERRGWLEERIASLLAITT